jgi:hypothetical protein
MLCPSWVHLQLTCFFFLVTTTTTPLQSLRCWPVHCFPSFSFLCVFLLLCYVAVRYGQAFMWGLTCTSGVGFDITPVTLGQTWFTVVALTIGLFFYAVILGSFSSHLTQVSYDVPPRSKLCLGHIR